ncbi:MAG: biotin--[Oscillospiraceae bacterium]|nr:biotin--[acetyl-CoA-carboxylase] ligase [Oscillospiraceae bacterium]
MTKDVVLQALWSHADRYLSGAELAALLSISRTAVWKAVEQLRAEGYLIEALPRKGYRLLSKSDVLSAPGIGRRLSCPALRVRYAKELGSTNTALKELADRGEPAGLALVAGRQTAGRGRMGRSFYSPEDTGVYLSLLLRPVLPAAEAVRLTACAAVAVAETLEELSGRPAQIKWVNDVFLDGKKVCGILTEASMDCESGQLSYAVVGIGVNALEPPGGFPEEIRDVAGAVFRERTLPELRCRIAAGILDRLWRSCGGAVFADCFEAYRSRSLVLGREVELISPGRDPVPARVLDLEPDYALRVQLPDGSVQRVLSGELRVRPLGPASL